MSPITADGKLSIEFDQDMLFPQNSSLVDYSKILGFEYESADGLEKVGNSPSSRRYLEDSPVIGFENEYEAPASFHMILESH